MSKLCERPGCSEPGAAAYGMVPEDLLFWLAPISNALTSDPNVLCRRHADAMVVPIGWTLDDRREEQPRLFKSRQAQSAGAPAATRRKKRGAGKAGSGEQLQIDGTDEIPRPAVPGAQSGPGEPTRAWQPDFDPDDDLNGLLEVSSPLLARAFRGRDRRRH